MEVPIITPVVGPSTVDPARPVNQVVAAPAIVPVVTPTTYVSHLTVFLSFVFSAFTVWHQADPNASLPNFVERFFPAGSRVTSGPNFFHIDWGSQPAPTPSPVPLPVPDPRPTPPDDAPASKEIAVGSMGLIYVIDPATQTPDQSELRTRLMDGVLSQYGVDKPRVFGVGDKEVDYYSVRRYVDRTPCLIFVYKMKSDSSLHYSPIHSTSLDDVIAEAKRLKGIVK